jgi:tetratricopeptide (TPR) repeat protein
MPRQQTSLMLVLAAILVVGCDNPEPERSAVASRLDAAIVRLKSIPTPSSPSPPVASSSADIPDYLEVRRAMRKGDIALLKGYLPGIAKRFDDGEINETVFEKALRPLRATLPEAIHALDAWVTESPNENAAVLARGIERAHMAFDERGNDFYRYIPKEDMRKMREWYALAADDMLRSIALSKRPIPAVRQLIEIAQVTGGMLNKSKALFAEGARIAPASTELFEQFVSALYGPWGYGTMAESDALIATAKKNGVDQNVWGDLARALYNERHGHVFQQDPRFKLDYAIDSTEEYGTYDTWLWRAKAESELKRFEDSAKSLDRAEKLRPDGLGAIEERAKQYELRGLFPEAVAEFERAAKMESAVGYGKLIYAYSNGGALGLEMDLGKTRILCEQAASLHQPDGEYCLGWLYQHGSAGLEQSVSHAAFWERKAAHQCHAVASQSLGYRLLVGLGAKVDREEGIFWLRRAARMHNTVAIELLKQNDEPIEDPALDPSIYSRMQIWIQRQRDN